MCAPQPTARVPTHALVLGRSAGLLLVAVVLAANARAQIAPSTVQPVMIFVVDLNSRIGHTCDEAVEEL